MKLKFYTLLRVIGIVNCLFFCLLKSNAQIYTYKDNERSLCISGGYGYNYDVDFDLCFTQRFGTSNYRLYTSILILNDKLKNSITPSIEVHSYIANVGLNYSFFDYIIPAPFNIYTGLTMMYGKEQSFVSNNKISTTNIYGFSGVISLEYFLPKDFSIFLKNHAMYLNSSFGEFRNSTLIGLNYNF